MIDKIFYAGHPYELELFIMNVILIQVTFIIGVMLGIMDKNNPLNVWKNIVEWCTR